MTEQQRRFLPSGHMGSVNDRTGDEPLTDVVLRMVAEHNSLRSRLEEQEGEIVTGLTAGGSTTAPIVSGAGNKAEAEMRDDTPRLAEPPAVSPDGLSAGEPGAATPPTAEGSGFTPSSRASGVPSAPAEKPIRPDWKKNKR